jgi:hypothetical protein
MPRTAIKPTGVECPLGERELIITKTDLISRGTSSTPTMFLCEYRNFR